MILNESSPLDKCGKLTDRLQLRIRIGLIGLASHPDVSRRQMSWQVATSGIIGPTVMKQHNNSRNAIGDNQPNCHPNKLHDFMCFLPTADSLKQINEHRREMTLLFDVALYTTRWLLQQFLILHVVLGLLFRRTAQAPI